MYVGYCRIYPGTNANSNFLTGKHTPRKIGKFRAQKNEEKIPVLSPKIIYVKDVPNMEDTKIMSKKTCYGIVYGYLVAI